MAELQLQFTDQAGEAPRLDVITATEQSPATKVSAPK
jgi:hypothetical protein